MNNLRTATALGGALLTTALVWTASGAVQADTDHPRRDTSFTVFEPSDRGVTHQVDLGEPGFGPGDLILERHPVLDPRTSHRLGTVTRQVQVIEVFPDGDFRFALHTTVRLHDGQVQYDGATKYSLVASGDALAAVTGGTGTFRHASGTVRGEFGQLDGAEGLYLTFKLRQS